MTSAVKLLVIIGNSEVRTQLRVLLEQKGYTVLEAENGKTALQKIKEIVPNLIILDLLLPDTDGFNLKNKIKAQLPGVKVPIIALSGFLNKPNDTQKSGMEFATCIVKPVNPVKLLEIISSYLPSNGTHRQVGNGKHILLADDSPTQLILTQQRLKEAGFQVTTASDGQEALNKIQEQIPDAVVSDILMPKIDGFELCFEIRNNPKLAHLPVILMTSHYIENADRLLAEKAAANYYLIRTPDAEELISVLDTCLKAPTSIPKSGPTEAFKEEHIHRITKQLEYYHDANLHLTQQCAIQTAQLSLLEGITEALTSNMAVEDCLQSTLAACLDAAGILRGAIYLVDEKNSVQLCNYVGYSLEDQQKLQTFFNQTYRLREVLANKNTQLISQKNGSANDVVDFLKKADLDSAVLVPILFRGKCLGILFLGNMWANISEPELLAFSSTLSAQLGQAIALLFSFEEINISEKRYRSLMDNASCTILITNLQGNILEINKQGEKLLNASKEEILNKKWQDFIFVNDEAHISKLINKLLLEKSVETQEIRIKPAKSSAINVVELSAVEVKIPTESLLMFIINDITERIQLKTRALLNDKLATMGTLAAGIAHEINNPAAWILANLNYIKGNLDNFKEAIDLLNTMQVDPDINRKVKALNAVLGNSSAAELYNQFNEAVEESTRGAEQIRSIVKSIKVFSHVDDEDNTLTNIHEVIKGALKMTYPEYKNRAQIEKDFDNTIPSIVINSKKLHQIFINLLINAAHALPENDIAHNYIRIKTYTQENELCVDIQDTGTGISPEIISRIFDPFFTTKETGTGLGLALCKEIMLSFNGKITVNSHPGRGSTFTITLPLENSASTNWSQTPREALTIVAKNILIIDDEPLLLKSLDRLLQKKHHVITALGGKAALDIINNKDIQLDAIVCDLNMPEISGKEIYMAICSTRPDIISSFLLMTGGSYTIPLKNFMREYNIPYIEKPFELDTILRKIEEITIKK